MGRGAGWAAVYGVTQSRTRLKWLSSSMGCYRRRWWHLTPVLLPGKSHGWRNLVGCSPWGLKESDMTEQLHFQFSLSCIGEGNGNPLQCSCQENPRDGGAWWAAVYGVTQSQTRLKRLSSSSSSNTHRVMTVLCTVADALHILFSPRINPSRSTLFTVISQKSELKPRCVQGYTAECYHCKQLFYWL